MNFWGYWYLRDLVEWLEWEGLWGVCWTIGRDWYVIF